MLKYICNVANLKQARFYVKKILQKKFTILQNLISHDKQLSCEIKNFLFSELPFFNKNVIFSTII